MKRLAISVLDKPVWHLLWQLGGPGLILLGLADNSLIPMPGSMDALTIVLSATRKDLWWYYAVMATVGAGYCIILISNDLLCLVPPLPRFESTSHLTRGFHPNSRIGGAIWGSRGAQLGLRQAWPCFPAASSGIEFSHSLSCAGVLVSCSRLSKNPSANLLGGAEAYAASHVIPLRAAQDTTGQERRARRILPYTPTLSQVNFGSKENSTQFR